MTAVNADGKISSTPARDDYIDALKGLLIFLVVYGHILEGNTPDGSVNCAVRTFIYLFHMPLFIFLSGMFSRVKSKERYLLSIIRLMETYAIFQLIHYVIPLPKNHGPISFNNYITFPTWTMWYILSLVSWRLIIYFLGEARLNNNKIKTMCIAIFISLAGGFIPVGYELSLQRTMCFWPFFMAGYYLNPDSVKKVIKKVPLWLAAIICAGALAVLYFVLGKSLGHVIYGSHNYYSASSELKGLLMRFMFFLAAITLSIAVMRLTPNCKLLANIGKKTLFIYIAHSFAAAVFYYLNGRFSWLGLAPSIFFVSLFITYLLYLLAKAKTEFVLNPLSTIVRFFLAQKTGQKP